MAYGNFADLPDFSTGPRGSADEVYRAIAKAGYEAVQGGDPDRWRAHGLEFIGVGTIPTPKDAEAFAAQVKKQGALAATCMRHFIESSEPERDLCFCPELAGLEFAYARSFSSSEGKLRQESDRWEQAGVLVALARECFARAERASSVS